jgi:hypothetical protein
MAELKTWKMDSQKRGDTFNQRNITFPFDITNCDINMQFRKQANDTVEFAWSTSDGTFEKVSATKVIMKSKLINANAGVYLSDLEVRFNATTIYTYCNATLQIYQDITQIP